MYKNLVCCRNGLAWHDTKNDTACNFVCCFLLYAGSIESQCVTGLDASLFGNMHTKILVLSNEPRLALPSYLCCRIT